MTRRYPLSANQWGMLFVSGISPESALYNVGLTCRTADPLDIQRLRDALAAVVRRQEALRTAFDLADLAAGRVSQVVEDDASVDLRTPCQPVTPEAAVAEPFDLTRAPLFRLTVVPETGGGHLLIWTFHHLIFDGWSVGILLRELSAAYAQPPGSAVLPPPRISYGAYAQWQAQAMPGLLARQLPYWRKQLADVPPLLELPAGQPRPPVQSFHGAELDASLPAGLRDRLAALAVRERVTLFTLLVAAFKAQLARYTGRSDIVIGCPVGARTQPGTSDLIGYFVNMTVLRTTVTPALTVHDLLRRVRGTVLDAFDHQDVPFDTLVTELRPPRSLAANPLFQVLFSYEEDVAGSAPLGEARMGPVRGIPTGGAKFDITLTVRDLRDEFALNIEYATDLFDRATIAAVADDYGRVLQAIADDPSVTIAELPLELPCAASRPGSAAAVETSVPYVAPTTEHERRLAEIWSEVLGLESIGTEDNFFLLGGNSLSASRVIARLTQAFGCELSVRVLFEQPTIGALAAHVAERAAGPAPREQQRVTRGPRLRLSELSPDRPAARG